MRSKDQIILEKIYTREILNEKRKERLFPMFQKLIQGFVDLPDGFPQQYNDPSIKWEFDAQGRSKEEYINDVKRFNLSDLNDDFQQVIKNVSVIVKKENLIMIILKKIRSSLEETLKDCQKYGVILDGERDEQGQEQTGTRDEYKDFLRRIPNMCARTVEHWNSLPIPKLHNYLKNVSPNEQWYVVARTADQYENDWKAQNKSWMDVTDDIAKGKIQEIIKLDNMAWFDLKRPYCNQEGEAMGHCGNAASRKKDDTVLSLRETKKQKDGIILSKPHLTFILMRGGFLGETKGRGNTKPQAKYHPHIMTLLMHKKEDGNYLVKGIDVGFGYKPENNFDIEDLSDTDLQKLANERILLIADKVQDYMLKKQQISPKLKAALNKSTNKENLMNEIKVRAKGLHLMKTHISSLESWPNITKIEPDFTIRYREKMTPEQVADVALNA